MREMARQAASSTAFTLDPVTFGCPDSSLGLPNVDVTISLPTQPLFSISTPRDLYSWLVADEGLMAFLTSSTKSALFGEAFPQLRQQNGNAYQQLVLYNWNSAVTTRSVRLTLVLREEASFPTQLGFSCESLQCEYQPLFETTAFQDFLRRLAQENILRDVVAELTVHVVLINSNQRDTVLEAHIQFPRNRGGNVTPKFSAETFTLQPYSTWDFTTVAAVALQVASAALFLFFGCSFFVEFCRLRGRLKEEREDYSFGLCLGVFFIDDLFNAFDIIGFIVLACAIFVWVLHVCASPHAEVLNLADDLSTALVAAASGATEEAEATAAAGVFFRAFSSTSALLRVYAQLAAAILAAAFLRLLRLGRKRKRMTMMFFAVASAAEEMIQVLIGTVLIFMGFAYLCFLSFGRYLENYSTLKNSFVSTIMLTTGFFPLSQLFQSDAFMAGVFVFPYLFFMGIICFSFSLCVLLRSLAHRSAEIQAMERLGKIEQRPLLKSLQLFLQELSCNFQPSQEEIQAQQKELELEHLQQQEDEATAFGKKTASDQKADFEVLQMIEAIERRRREMPLKVVDLPPDVITSALSDDQYAALPDEVRSFANQEAALFVDRFRKLAIQFQLGSGDVVSLLQQLENDAYVELWALAHEVAQQEGHLQHELSVYTSHVINGQQRLLGYIKFLEQALQDKEEELQLQLQELRLLEIKVEDEKQAAERYGTTR
ncbi:hypothetical protein ETH_00004730 [Eimeria tenella]|uniref:Polycystin cation channel PKD1/PKD2 domain-containing protein n=1 Tax=Eimeria tenella TaxID=5802 RepID=U6KND2_EIMTE|nr:hypothetical protein ETH_00004730 [Eimeria tenella]CDJ36953.1 hypothetical protein ETH_00004730 [Eimeria tenella]|eukprot:XP_013227791.1 hypothetical protein ETH_00004730 [Eimeria tenella]